MKGKVIQFGVAAILCGWLVSAAGAKEEIAPEDMIEAVRQMTPEQAHEYQSLLAAQAWEPVPEGLFTKLGLVIGASASSLDEVGLPAGMANELDLTDVSGSEISLLWALNPLLRVGLKFGGWYAEDSALSGAGYSSGELAMGTLGLLLNYQVVRTARWLVWGGLDAGGGGAELETVNTPAGEATTLRRFTAEFGYATPEIGVAWRINPLLSISASGGYRFAGGTEFDEGGEDGDLSLNASGAVGSLALTLNF